MTIGDCWEALGIDRYATVLPDEFKHLANAGLPIWRRQVFLKWAVVTVKAPFATFAPVKETGRRSSKRSPQANTSKVRDRVAVDDRLVAAGLGGPPLPSLMGMSSHLRGWFEAQDAERIGQVHKDVPFPCGGRGDIVVLEICDTEGGPPGLVDAIVELRPAAWPPMLKGQLPIRPYMDSKAAKSDYVRCRYASGWCPVCSQNEIMLLVVEDSVDTAINALYQSIGGKSRPAFYICKCGWIGEIGVGPVEEG